MVRIIKILKAIDLLIEGGADLKTVLSQNGLIKELTKGMSLSDIKSQLQELYGAEVSESLISRITDEVIEETRIWFARSLVSGLVVQFLDTIIHSNSTTTG